MESSNIQVYIVSHSEVKFMDEKVTFKQLKKYVDELNEKQKSEHAIFLIRKND